MNITFQNQPGITGSREHRTGRVEEERSRIARNEQKKTASANGAAVDASFLAGPDGLGIAGETAQGGSSHGKGKTLTDLQQEAANIDVGVSQDYMTLMSHTMSEEDYAELSEEGFHFQSLDPKQAVTIVDRIKAELVRSGKQIAGYTDDLDMDTLAAALGSDVLAKAVRDSFQEADIPLTKENLEGVRAAWDMAAQLESPTEGSCRYMIDNAMEPEVWDYYLAQNSGAAQGGVKGREAADFLQDDNIARQIDHVLEQAGYEVNEENRALAGWLLERELPLTAENLERMDRLRGVEFPVTEEAFARAAAVAVSEGKEPIHANLADESADNVYGKALKALERYQQLYDAETDIAARKQLEEIRLRMTAEVNVKLLKSGFAIDTAPMVELIEALREAERAVAQQYFPDDENAVSKYESWNEANQVMAEIPTLPIELLGHVRISEGAGEEATTVSHFYAEGKDLQQAYAKAGESYEALMTAPRADLGDSIRKAFANVDDILEDMGLELTEDNRRAVRILGYNHMEMSLENIEQVRGADRQVRDLTERMTPAAALKMIRDGVNPLEQSFAQLNQYFDDLPESYREQAENYSKYLYGLEQNKQITAEERESYIGVYRLLRQIERSDGAAIGAVLNTRAELQFSNLLSAVRSGKFKHMDVKATDEMGVLKELVRKGESASISEQISRNYQKQQLDEARRAMQTDPAAPAMLQRGELPVNVENLLAAQGLIRDALNPFKTLRERSERLRREAAAAESIGQLPVGEAIWESLEDKEAFRQQYNGMVEDLQAWAETYTTEAQSSLDVRGMQMAHKQLSILGSLSGNEEYILPMYVGGDLAAVHLTLERGTGEKGGISIAVDFAEGEHIEAHLRVGNGRVEGFLVGNTAEEVTKLKAAADIFNDFIQDASIGLEADNLPVVSRGNIKLTGMSENNSQEPANAPDNGMLYHVAKLFLQAIRE